MAASAEILRIADHEVTITNPGKVFFPQLGLTKLDLVRYYLAVAEGALAGVGGRPMALKRYPNGVESEPFYQKRAPEKRPDWIETVELKYSSGRSAEEIVVRDAAQLAWVVNLGCVDLHPHPCRAEDLARPDELRIDLDPTPGIAWGDLVSVALTVREVLADHGLTGWPKTSGSRGFHVYAPIEPNWKFTEARKCALAVAREVERRLPDLATAEWWKEERHGVFVDFNQMAYDRTTASAYSVRPTPDGRVSTPLTWEEVADSDPAAFTVGSVPQRFAERGDPWAAMTATAGPLDSLLELAKLDKRPAPRAGAVPGAAPGKDSGPTGRRRTTMPLIEVARAASRDEALQGLERWKERHAGVWPLLEAADVLVDQMRGRSTAWFRIRLNLRHVPQGDRPAQEPLEVDYDPWAGFRPPAS